MATVLNDGRDFVHTNDPLPANIPGIRAGYVAAVYYGQRRSGDFYDFVRVNPQCVLFGLFDVAGGLRETRTIMCQLQSTFRSVGPQLLQAAHGNISESMIELWIRLNKEVMQAADGVHSCPAFLGCYNEDNETLSYVNAGHTPGLCRHDRQVTELGPTALPLGLFSHTVPDCSVVFLGPGNGLLVISKGMVEAKRRGEEYGLERAKQYFGETGFQSAHETCVGLLSRVREFMGTAPTHDDVTALSLIRAARLSG